MRKTKAIILGILILIPFIFLSFYIYYKLPTTPVLIITLLFLMTGVILAYFVYNKVMGKIIKEDVINSQSEFPKIEPNMLLVSPSDFCEKLEKTEGTLYFLAGFSKEEKITLIEGEYKKLTDELILKFTSGIKLIVKDIEVVEVGYNQFIIRQFSELQLVKNQQKYQFYQNGNKITRLNKNEKTTFKVPHKKPFLLFSWRD